MAEKVTYAPRLPLAAFTVILARAAMVGAVVSRTVIVNVAVAVRPPESVAQHVTVVVPSGYIAPELWLQ